MAEEHITMYNSFQIGNCKIKNRLVASAMFEYAADNGRINNKIIERYRQLAEGGSGLIITGMYAVRKAGSTAPIMVNTEYDNFVDDFKKIADIVHKNNGKIFVQLQHCGYKTYTGEGFDRFGVCDKDDFHQATKNELYQLTLDFGTAARRCKLADADGVQIHAAHGYLLNTFLSPSTNHRVDEYGGNIDNRAKLLFEIYQSIRKSVGNDYPISVKFPFSDLNNESILPKESLHVCKTLENLGIDMIEISSGMVMDNSIASFIPIIHKNTEPPFFHSAKDVAEIVNIPVISVCGYRNPDFISKVLNTTKITAVSFGRPLVREPALPNRWIDDKSPAKCISCNGCCKSYLDGILTCQVEKQKAKNVL